MNQRFRRLYGASPLHLLALIASLLIAGAAVVGWFDNTVPITERILFWFLGAIIGHDLVLLPLYSLLDRIAVGSRRDAKPVAGAAVSPPARSPGWVYVRVPALLSGLLALVFFPEILRLGNSTFQAASGMTQDVYLSRFLFTCGALFAISGVAFAASLQRARSAGRRGALSGSARAAGTGEADHDSGSELRPRIVEADKPVIGDRGEKDTAGDGD